MPERAVRRHDEVRDVDDLADPQVDRDAAQQVGLDRRTARARDRASRSSAGPRPGPPSAGRARCRRSRSAARAQLGVRIGRGEELRARSRGRPCARSGGPSPASASRSPSRTPRRRPASRARRRSRTGRPPRRRAGTASSPRPGAGCPCSRRGGRAGSCSAGRSSGATPISPQNGASGTWMPGQYSARPPAQEAPSPCRYGSAKSSASSPKPGMLAVQPQFAGSSSRMSIWSESPGSAPATSTGPLTWSTWSKTSVSRSAVVDFGGQLPVRRIEAIEADDVARRRPSRPAGSPGPRPGGSRHGRRGWSAYGARSCLLRVCGGSRSPASRRRQDQAGVAGWRRAGAAGATSSVSPIASRTERSLSRSRNREVEPDDDPDQHPDPDQWRDERVRLDQRIELRDRGSGW